MNTPTKVDVGGYHLAYQTFGSGDTTVVLECGGEDTSKSLETIALAVRTFSRAFIYDRAGLGLSDPPPHPRTIQDAVSDLHALLQRADMPGPYLLVGHSFGGLIVRLYAAQFPREVLGLVLLDVPHPELALRELARLPAPSPHEPAALTSFRNHATSTWTEPSSNQEGFDIAASAEQVMNSNDIGDIPLVVISAGQDEWDEGFPEEIARVLEQDWMQMQQEFVKLSTNSRHIIATESTHAIQDCQPELIVATIRGMLDRHQAHNHSSHSSRGQSK